jgi:hypothetical protein
MFRYIKCLNAFFRCMQTATRKRTVLHLFRMSWESAALVLVRRFLFHLKRIVTVTLQSMRVFCSHERDLISRCYDYTYDVFPFVLCVWKFVSILRKEYESEESENRVLRTDREKVIRRWRMLTSLIIHILILLILELRTCSSHGGN